jgi:peptide/nickel transport system substrate-binding protein
MRLRTGFLTAAVVSAAVVVAACSSGSGTSGGGASSTAQAATAQSPQSGGTLNYLVTGVLSQWSLGLDPATGGAAPSIFEDAIFGQLFRLSPSGGIQPVMASGYQLTAGGTVLTITLRPGLKFTDGTALDAAALVWNIKRDLATPSTASPATSWPALASSDGITTPTDTSVRLHFTKAYAPVMATLIGSNVNHVVSPAAVAKLGAAFKDKPVGAGPFVLTANLVNHQITLKRNPGYWQKGRPYLDELQFTTVSDDQTAAESLQSDTGQAAQMTTPAIIKQAQGNSAFSTVVGQGVSPSLVQLNTAVPPFNNKLARQAIYYATDAQALADHLYNGMFPTAESFLGPGDLFYAKTIPGYPGYDLAKAKQLVSQLGGLTVSLFGPNDPLNTEALQALAQLWGQAGIKVSIHPYALSGQIQAFQKGGWQAALQSNGAYDPGTSSGLAFRFLSTAQYSGVHDKTLDAMMAQANGTLDAAKRASLYQGIAQYLSSQAYAPFLVAVAPVSVTRKEVHGPGLSTPTRVLSVVITPSWDEAWIGK